MKFNAFLKTIFLVSTILFIVSCDKDYNEIGADLIDDVHYGFEAGYASVKAYNVSLGPVQTSNLPINSLGYFENGVFGTTTASFVTQLELETVNPKFYGEEDLTQFKIDSVYLYVPYFSTLKSTDATTGDSTYELDSIQGGTNKIKLGVYESNYFLRNLDPNAQFQEQQRYYSNESFLVEGVTDVANFNNRLNNISGEPHPDQDAQFEFKNTEIKILKNNTPVGSGTVKERLAPGIYMDLNRNFFMNKIVNAPAGSLVDNNVFKDYFKGIYFKALPLDPSATQGTMARLDFTKGKIVIIYHGKDSDTSTEGYKRKTLTLNMAGRTVNFFDTNFVNPIVPNPTTGDEKLYLKGGAGSMTVLKLFSGTEIQDIKSNGWLINEANLVFHVDRNAIGTAEEPNRIYLFDLNNKRPLLDYTFDSSTNPTYPKYDKYVHGGILEVDENKKGIKYKIRLTNHVRNIINNDSTNVTLGLVVTESINNKDNVKLKNSFTAFGSEIKFIPAMSVANPLGTILWGNTSSVPEDKKLKFEIFYTKPD